MGSVSHLMEIIGGFTFCVPNVGRICGI